MKLSYKNSKIIGITLGVLLFIILSVGITYATGVWKTTDYAVTLNSKCLIKSNYIKSDSITDSSLLLINPENDPINRLTVKKGMALSNFSIWKTTSSTCNVDGYLRIALNVTDLPTEYASGGDNANAIKYALFYYDPDTYPTVNSNVLDNVLFTTLTSGYIYDTGIRDIYYDTIMTSSTRKNYILAIYVDGNLVNTSVSDAVFNANLEVSVEQSNGSMPNIPISYPAFNNISDFVYQTNNSNISLNSYIGQSSIVSVPASYEISGVTYDVDSLELSQNTDVTRVYIDNDANISSLSNAFYGCTNLVAVPVIPSSVTNLYGAFGNCTSLSGTIRVNSSEVSNTFDAFRGVSNNITVEVPANSTTYNTFANDRSLPFNITIATY